MNKKNCHQTTHTLLLVTRQCTPLEYTNLVSSSNSFRLWYGTTQNLGCSFVTFAYTGTKLCMQVEITIYVTFTHKSTTKSPLTPLPIISLL